MGGVWRVFDCCGGRNVLDNQPERWNCVVFGRGAEKKIRQQTTSVLVLKLLVEAALTLMPGAVVAELVGRSDVK